MGIRLVRAVGIINRTNMYQQIEVLLAMIGSYPEKPRKPVLLTGATSDDIRKYADAFDEFQIKFAEFEAKRVEYYQRKNEVEASVAEFIKDESGFYFIPEQYRDKVWRIAWEEGHSAGYHEVYQWLTRLVEIFE